MIVPLCTRLGQGLQQVALQRSCFRGSGFCPQVRSIGTINFGGNLRDMLSPAVTPWLAWRLGWEMALSLTAILALPRFGWAWRLDKARKLPASALRLRQICQRFDSASLAYALAVEYVRLGHGSRLPMG